VGALAPLGRVDADALGTLAGVAARSPVRVSTRRTVTALDLEPREAAELLRALSAAGLLTEPGSGWEGLTACAGTGACGSARADVRAAAAARASEREEDAPREHWSACGRRCGQTPDVARAVTARADGTWDVTEVKA
jgi:sulfite reductase beta subunit-like hemoprotein